MSIQPTTAWNQLIGCLRLQRSIDILLNHYVLASCACKFQSRQWCSQMSIFETREALSAIRTTSWQEGSKLRNKSKISESHLCIIIPSTPPQSAACSPDIPVPPGHKPMIFNRITENCCHSKPKLSMNRIENNAVSEDLPPGTSLFNVFPCLEQHRKCTDFYIQISAWSRDSPNPKLLTLVVGKGIRSFQKSATGPSTRLASGKSLPSIRSITGKLTALPTAAPKTGALTISSMLRHKSSGMPAAEKIICGMNCISSINSQALKTSHFHHAHPLAAPGQVVSTSSCSGGSDCRHQLWAHKFIPATPDIDDNSKVTEAVCPKSLGGLNDFSMIKRLTWWWKLRKRPSANWIEKSHIPVSRRPLANRQLVFPPKTSSNWPARHDLSEQVMGAG